MVARFIIRKQKNIFFNICNKINNNIRIIVIMELFEVIFTVNKIQIDVLGFIVYYTSVLFLKI